MSSANIGPSRSANQPPIRPPIDGAGVGEDAGRPHRETPRRQRAAAARERRARRPQVDAGRHVARLVERVDGGVEQHEADEGEERRSPAEGALVRGGRRAGGDERDGEEQEGGPGDPEPRGEAVHGALFWSRTARRREWRVRLMPRLAGRGRPSTIGARWASSGCRRAWPTRRPDDAWLSPREAAWVARMRFPKRRSEFRLGRWTAKKALALYLGRDASAGALRSIEIDRAPDGAPLPLVDGPPGRRPT